MAVIGKDLHIEDGHIVLILKKVLLFIKDYEGFEFFQFIATFRLVSESKTFPRQVNFKNPKVLFLSKEVFVPDTVVVRRRVPGGPTVFYGIQGNTPVNPTVLLSVFSYLFNKSTDSSSF